MNEALTSLLVALILIVLTGVVIRVNKKHPIFHKKTNNLLNLMSFMNDCQLILNFWESDKVSQTFHNAQIYRKGGNLIIDDDSHTAVLSYPDKFWVDKDTGTVFIKILDMIEIYDKADRSVLEIIVYNKLMMTSQRHYNGKCSKKDYELTQRGDELHAVQIKRG